MPIPFWRARSVLACALSAVAASTATAQPATISTGGGQSSQLCCVTAPGASNDGSGVWISRAQSFQLPTGAGAMRDFTVPLWPNIGVLQYHAYVVAWDAANARVANAAPLWSSATMTSPSTPTDVRFDVGGLTLLPGQSYAFLLTVITPDGSLTPQSVGGSSMAMVAATSNPYAGGSLYRFVSYPPPSTRGSDAWNAMTNNRWDEYGYDMFFEARFDGPVVAQVAPEPGTLPLALAGGLAVAGAAVRRRRAVRAA